MLTRRIRCSVEADPEKAAVSDNRPRPRLLLFRRSLVMEPSDTAPLGRELSDKLKYDFVDLSPRLSRH
jgi:hypothetical protein